MSPSIKVKQALLVGLIFVFLLHELTGYSNAEEPDRNGQILNTAGRAFLEAEFKKYLETYLNQHPPTEGMEAFGSGTMFALEFLLAADAYLKADNDKKRFAAARAGLAAYLGYAYAATPAVGLAATAVVFAVQIIEFNVTGSYVEGMLRIAKEINEIQLRINDLNHRLGEAEALRFLVLVNELGRVIEDLQAVNLELRLDCKKRADNFDILTSCLTKFIRSITLRQEQLRALDRLIVAPDLQVAQLKLSQNLKPSLPPAGSAQPEAIPQAKKKEEVPNEVKQIREFLSQTRKSAEEQLNQLKGVYEGFLASYQKLAVQYIFDEALREPQQLALIKQVQHRCLMDKSSISRSATTLTLTIVRLQQELKGKPQIEILDEVRKLSVKATSLLANFAQRRDSCPSIQKDMELAKLINLLENRFSGLKIQ